MGPGWWLLFSFLHPGTLHPMPTRANEPVLRCGPVCHRTRLAAPSWSHCVYLAPRCAPGCSPCPLPPEPPAAVPATRRLPWPSPRWQSACPAGRAPGVLVPSRLWFPWAPSAAPSDLATCPRATGTAPPAWGTCPQLLPLAPSPVFVPVGPRNQRMPPQTSGGEPLPGGTCLKQACGAQRFTLNAPLKQQGLAPVILCEPKRPHRGRDQAQKETEKAQKGPLASGPSRKHAQPLSRNALALQSLARRRYLHHVAVGRFLVPSPEPELPRGKKRVKVVLSLCYVAGCTRCSRLLAFLHWDLFIPHALVEIAARCCNGAGFRCAAPLPPPSAHTHLLAAPGTRPFPNLLELCLRASGGGGGPATKPRSPSRPGCVTLPLCRGKDCGSLRRIKTPPNCPGESRTE